KKDAEELSCGFEDGEIFRVFLRQPVRKYVIYKESGTATCVNSKASPNACTNTQMSSPLDIGCPLCLGCTFVELAILRVSRHFLFISHNV
ncbi:hypothetical protein, partial [Bacteroides uniformis]|uniref:hypothetical protein n=1 Tax=Bacteroides uniformis TaxID=820 RepID=UPI000FF79C16